MSYISKTITERYVFKKSNKLPMTFMLVLPSVGYNDNIDEGEAIARAIAASQQDFISSLTKKS